MIVAGSTIGMLGGGQLGRMFTIAARILGYKVMVLEPDSDSPAGQLADEHVAKAYDDRSALDYLIQHCNVVTIEFENIPVHVLRYLAKKIPVYPHAESMEKTQNRVVEKAFIHSCGLLPVPYLAINAMRDLTMANIKKFKFPAILKTARFGYDGKGQLTVQSADDLKTAFENLGQVACVLEQQIELQREISVILGRNIHGESHCFPVAENVHVNGILDHSIVPANIDENMTRSAQAAAKRMADKLDYCGVLAVEFFISKDGELFVNEIAPRTHNSGHYSIDACITSQFEQQVRMVCDLPFGDTTLLSPVVMVNLLGDLWQTTSPNWSKILQHQTTKLHLYGKKVARVGRKMGHFCTLADNTQQAQNTTYQIMQALKQI